MPPVPLGVTSFFGISLSTYPLPPDLRQDPSHTETSSLTEVEPASVSIDDAQFAATSSGITISSFKKNEALNQEIRDESDVTGGYDSEGQIGPFQNDFDSDSEDEEPVTPCTNASASEVSVSSVQSVDVERLTVVQIKEELKDLNQKAPGKKVI